jgi:GDP-L-fucose synthase
MYRLDPTEIAAHLSEAELERTLARYSNPRRPLGPGELASTREFWRDRRVILTGSLAFLGAHVESRLKALGCGEIVKPESEGCNLLDQAAVRHLFREVRPDTVLHLAEQVGGIGAQQRNPGQFFYDNLMMGALLIEEARRAGTRKFVQTGTICSYPKYAPVPFREEDLWNGYPDESNAPFGIAKRALLTQLQAYRAEYGFRGIYLVPVNLYGPADDFDLATSYVIPALIRKMVEAKSEGRSEVEVWGTGEATREFLYVAECARAVLLGAEYYDGSEPINLGTGSEIRIKELAQLIARLVGYEGALRFNPLQPDGQPRRQLDTTKAHQLFGFRSHVTLDEGLRQTIHWFREFVHERKPAHAGG